MKYIQYKMIDVKSANQPMGGGIMDVFDYSKSIHSTIPESIKVNIDDICNALSQYIVSSIDGILNNKENDHSTSITILDTVHRHLIHGDLKEDIKTIAKSISEQFNNFPTDGKQFFYRTYSQVPLNNRKSIGEYVLTTIRDEY